MPNDPRRHAAETLAILDDLRRIVRVLRESSRAAEQRIGVTGAQLFVLRILSASPALSLTGLARRSRTHQSTVSVVAKRLVGRGLVSRTTSSADRRRLEFRITPAGRALLRRAPLAAQDRLIDGLESLPAAERRRLAAALGALVRTMGLDEQAPVMFFEEGEGPARGRTARDG